MALADHWVKEANRALDRGVNVILKSDPDGPELVAVTRYQYDTMREIVGLLNAAVKVAEHVPGDDAARVRVRGTHYLKMLGR